MSYEYKDEIIEDVKAHCKTKNKNIAVYPVYHHEDKVEEIHNVYAQAAKANEYEAKAKAWDKLMVEIDRITEEATVKGLPPKTTLVTKVIAVTMAKKEYESGESE